MKFVFQLSQRSQLEQLSSLEDYDIILTFKEFSKISEFEWSEYDQIISMIPDHCQVFLQWDILMKDEKLHYNYILMQKNDLDQIDAIRVSDLGAAMLLDKKLKKKFHLIVEGHSHNVDSLLSYENSFEFLERIVLSSELTINQLKTMKDHLKVSVERLLYGPLLLFYTPRKLLDEEIDDKKREMDSEESPHKNFPVIQNQHGTFMFLSKRLNLFSRQENLSFIDYFRIDFMLDSQFEYSTTIIPFDRKNHTRGYLDVNKSQVLFPKLKNSRLLKSHDNFLGEVIESKKDYFTVIKIANQKSIKLGQQVELINPEGKKVSFNINVLKNSSYESQESISSGSLAFIHYISKAWPRSVIFLQSDYEKK